MARGSARPLHPDAICEGSDPAEGATGRAARMMVTLIRTLEGTKGHVLIFRLLNRIT